MSGTRKMEKFELDAFLQKREARRSEDDVEAAVPGEWIPPQLEESAALEEEAALPVLANGPPPMRGIDSEPHPVVPPFPSDEVERPAPAKSGRALRSEAPQSERRAAHAPVRPPAKSDPTKDEASVEITSPPRVDALRTRLAAKFVTLADQVTEAFGDFSIGAGAWAVELTAPAGMSTGGGKQALQHLRLRPRRPGYPVILAGTVNQVEKVAELRDYDHAFLAHEVRFRQTLDITPPEWEQLLRKAEVVLGGAQVKVTRTPPPKDLLEQSKSLKKVSPVGMIALIVVLLLAAIVLWRVAVAIAR